MLLEAEPDLQVVGEAGDGPEALRLAEKLRPNILIVDVMMPGLSGLKESHNKKTLAFRYYDSIPFGLRPWPTIWFHFYPLTNQDKHADFNARSLAHIYSNPHLDPNPKTACFPGDSHAGAFGCHQPGEQREG